MLLHHLQELDNHFRARPDQDLALAGLLGVEDRGERIVEHRRANHFDEWVRFSGRNCGVRYLYGYDVSLQEPFERKECPRLQVLAE